MSTTDPWQDEQEVPSAPPLSREEARALLLRKPQVSIWRVVALQAAVAAVCAVVAWFVSGNSMSVALSALYGGAIIALPSALFAGGIRTWLSKLQPGVAVYGFALGELLKIGLTIALLWLAPRVVQPLSWAALLVTVVVTLQVYWIAFVLRGKVSKPAQGT